VISRRQALGSLAVPAAAAFFPALLRPGAALAAGRLEELGRGSGTPEEVAADESFWIEAQQAYLVDRSLVNLNNGGVSPTVATSHEAMKRHLDFSQGAPAYSLWTVLEPQREAVRQRLAGFFGCDPEEIALTRNASEGLQICQLGLDLEPGDEVLTTTQDYPRMLNTFKQREAREGIVLREVAVPVPAEDPEEIVGLLEAGITPRTRMILICHVINLTGQIMPVRALCELGRERGIPVVVDGAHSFAHFPFTVGELGCDYFATSLHKWLSAPHGTGLLFVRKERIGDLWPLMASPAEKREDIRKFEEIGTHPAAPYLAIAEALTFQEILGTERKAARLRYLRDRWARRLLENDRIRLHTSLRPEFSCGIATFRAEGLQSRALCEHLWEEHRILTAAIEHAEFEGIRVTPHVYTTLEELDRFCDAVETALESGLPA
jgi:selenocysteine lyase/cysteine desulfurase